MGYKIVKGNLLDLFEQGEFNVIAHGCNCFHTMGAGIALQIAQKYPIAFTADKETKYGDIQKLSQYSLGAVEMNRIIVNMYTQFRIGADFNLAALDLGFYKLAEETNPIFKIGIPKIGAGIAGGNWDQIEPIIKEHLSDFDVTLVEYEPKK